VESRMGAGADPRRFAPFPVPIHQTGRRAAREEEIAPYGGAAGPSNGCASSTAAGKTASRTGKTFIWPAQPNGIFFYSASQNLCKCRELLESVCENNSGCLLT